MAVDNSGWGLSERKLITINQGETGSGTPTDLGRVYAWIVVRCADVSPAANTTDVLSFALGVGVDDSMSGVLLRDASDEVITIALSDEFQRVLFVGAARRIQILVDNAPDSGNLVLEVYGVDGAASNV